MDTATLRSIRENNNKTCGEIAQLLGKTLKAYLRYEKGLKEISGEQFSILAEYYKVTSLEMFKIALASYLGGSTVERREEARPKNNKRLYHVYSNMKQRCYNPNCPDWKDYGGRGIAICDEWRNDFAVFYDWAIDAGYDENSKCGECTIDRIDNDGNYEPSNCQWVSMVAQNNNRRIRRGI